MCAAVADKRGLKRVCADCGIRFYDMNKRPINCPNCEKEFTGAAEKVKARRGRIAVEKELPVNKAAEVANDDDIEIEEGEAAVISLDELENSEGELDDDDLDTDIDLGDDDLGDLDGDDEDLEESDEEEDKE